MESRPSLTHIPIFATLDADGEAALAPLLATQHVGAGQPIVWFGERGDTMYVVDSGQVEVSAPDSEGTHVLLDTLGPGGVFGELSLLDGGPRSATVRARSDCRLFTLTRPAFQQFVRQRPEVAIDILHVMAARQRASTSAIRRLPNPNRVIAESATRWQRASDIIAEVAASQAFTLLHLVWFGAWILVNVLGSAGLLPEPMAFDPFPFGLLTLIVSLESIFLAIFVLVSQNRQSERDRIRTDLDYQVNVKAHVEIVEVNRRLEQVEQILSRIDRQTAPSG